MTLDVAQSAALLIIATLAIALLLRILVVVHRQNRTMSELQMRMKAMEKLEAEQTKTAPATDEAEKGRK